MKKIASTLLISVIFGLATVPMSFAQPSQTKQDKQSRKVKEKIKKLGTGERVKIKVKLYNDTTYQGYLKEANDDDFVIVDKGGGSTTVKYSDVKSTGGKNLSTGAKIAIAASAIGAIIFFAVFWAVVQNDE